MDEILLGKATRAHDFPPSVDAYAAPSPGPGDPWVNVEPAATHRREVAQVIELIDSAPKSVDIDEKLLP